MLDAYTFHRRMGIVFKMFREHAWITAEDVCDHINGNSSVENVDGNYFSSYELGALEAGHRTGTPIYFWYRLFRIIDEDFSYAVGLVEDPGRAGDENKGLRTELESVGECPTP